MTAPEREAQSFRKKPVVIQAAQWFCPGHCPIWAQDRVRELSDRFEVATLEGCMEGIPGDWIIRGVKGEIYPCKPDIFEMTYEPAEANAPAVTVTEGWKPIETAPKDGTEVLLFRQDGGIFLGRYISMIDFLTDAEAAGVPVETLEQEDWFYADFLQGGRLEGDQVPTHWQAMPSPPSTTPQTGSQE